mgnify:CR=1 FL=1
MKKDKRLIPFGDYCYTRRTRREKKCPYWSIRKGKPKMRNGYCAFLEKGDWNINDEKVWTMRMKDKNGKYKQVAKGTATELGIEGSWLWDQVKACGIKYEIIKTSSSRIKGMIKTTLKDLKNIKEKKSEKSKKEV